MWTSCVETGPNCRHTCLCPTTANAYINRYMSVAVHHLINIPCFFYLSMSSTTNVKKRRFSYPRESCYVVTKLQNRIITFLCDKPINHCNAISIIIRQPRHIPSMKERQEGRTMGSRWERSITIGGQNLHVFLAVFQNLTCTISPR